MELHDINNEVELKSAEGLQNVSCSNDTSICNPCLGFNEIEEKGNFLLEKLADILLDIYITKKKNENNNRQAKASSDLC
jgi:hypothetical protein